MIKNYFLILLFLISVDINAQTVLSSTSFVNNNGSGTVTFNLQNTNTYDIIITNVAGVTGSSGSLSCEVWYKTTPVNGSPGAISTGNGWVLGATGTFVGVSNTSTSTTQPFLSNTNIIIPANTTYGMAIFATGQRYSTISGTPSFTAGGVTFLSGTNIGYGGGTPPATPGNSPRGWIGELTFIPACFNPTGLAASNVTTTSADISWSPVPSSFGYEYIVNQIPTSPSGSGTFTTSTSASVTGLTINTAYYFHVRNKCASAFSSWTNYPFTTADAYCKPPVNVLFNNITTSSAGVLWSLMPTADHYDYLFDLTPNPPLPGIHTSTTNIYTNISGLLPDTRYYFFVRSICLGGSDSSTWKVDSFVTKAGCMKPEVTVVNPGNLNQDVYWNKVTSAVSYEYKQTDNIMDPAFGTEITDTFLSVTLPQDLSNQYLHVRSKCNSQFTFSDWSTAVLREIPTSVNTVSASTEISVYPNPAHNMLYVKNALNTTYKIFNMLGAKMTSGIINGEEVAVPIDVLSPGIYVIEVESATGKHFNRFVKQ